MEGAQSLCLLRHGFNHCAANADWGTKARRIQKSSGEFLADAIV
jgi:hypothetical protein